jgi:plasmid stabilization system protein ParE
MANNSAYTAIISSRAQKELAESWAWYEDRLPGLGDRFTGEVLKRIRQIQDNPDRYPTRFKLYKEAQVDTFPFLIIFRIINKTNLIRVVSVFHTAQNPGKKYK